MLQAESNMTTPPTILPAICVEYLPTVTPGDAATIRLGIREDDLENGFELWVRGTEKGPYQRLRNTTSALSVVWQGDLQLLELVCFCPQSRNFMTCREYLRRQPSTGIQVKATDHAVTFVSQPDTAPDLWQQQRLPGHPGGWRPLKLPRAEFAFEPKVSHGLLSLENSSGQPHNHVASHGAKHVAVAFDSELTIGRLHRGLERHRNQSRRGAHWHLGWQRIATTPDHQTEGVTCDLMETTRDWMSRSAGTLRVASSDENLGLKATSLGLPEEFRLHQRNSHSWDLDLAWSTYSDSLRIHAEEACGQIEGRRVQLPWFWATRRQIVPELEDRFYLWLPGWKRDLPGLVGVGGWIGSEVRWSVEDGYLAFLDTGMINQPG
jgi:hypothetical protein